jgi:hypothetical protein
LFINGLGAYNAILGDLRAAYKKLSSMFVFNQINLKGAMAFSITAFNIMGLLATFSIHDNQHNKTNN